MPSSTTTSGSASQTTQLYERLRAAILGLDLAPGEHLSERGLEQAFGASRTPARAALMRLESEGLVRREGRSWMVTPIDLTEIHAISEMRSAVESAAVRHAVTRASDDDIAALGALLDADRPSTGHPPGGQPGIGQPGIRQPSTGQPATIEEQGVRAGSNFHAELVQLSGNPFMVESVQGAMTRLERTRWLEVRTPESRLQAWNDHRAIVEALAARDAEGAAGLVAQHIHETNERLIAALTADQQRLRGHGLAVRS